MTIFVEKEDIIVEPIVTVEHVSPTNPLPGIPSVSNIKFRYKVGSNPQLDEKLKDILTIGMIDIYLDYAVLKECVCFRILNRHIEDNNFLPIVELEFMVNYYVDLRNKLNEIL